MARRFSRRFVDDRSLGATQGMGAVFLGSKPDRLDPFINEAGILPCAHVSRWINPARECVIIHCPTASFQPCEKAGACVAHQLELNRSTGFLLDDHRASSDFLPYNKVADFDLDEIAAAHLLSIAKSKSALSRRRRSRSRKKRIAHICRGFRGRSDFLACIPCSAIGGGEIVARVSHFVSPSAMIGHGRNA